MPTLRDQLAIIRQRCATHRRQLNTHGSRLEDESPEDYRRRLLELPTERFELQDVLGYDS
jgi:hypothetical protein